MAAMGSFRIDIEIENPARRGERRKVRHALVDTGAELSWVPGDVLRSLGIEPMKQWSFRQATGQIIERWVGSVLIYAALRQTDVGSSCGVGCWRATAPTALFARWVQHVPVVGTTRVPSPGGNSKLQRRLPRTQLTEAPTSPSPPHRTGRPHDSTGYGLASSRGALRPR